jgi:hypothetical protein
VRKYLIVFFVALVACSSDPGALPKVPDFKPAATTTTDVDYSGAPLKGVNGRAPTTTIAIGPGPATVSGSVIGDEGPIAGATVQVERVAGGQTAGTTVATAEDGSWQLPKISGGRYRVRAWRAPDLAQTTWTGFFLGATETKTVQLRLRAVGGLSVEASIAPDPPRVFQEANLVVLVAVKMVDDQGVVRATPQDNVQVELVTGSGWRVFSSNPTTTDSRGEASWSLRCRASGHQSIAVTVGTQTIPLTINNGEESTPDTTTTTAEVGLVP